MKRFALAAAIVMLAACGGAKEEAMPAADSAAPAMSPAPAMDSASMMMDSSMSHDSAADTTMH